MSSQGASEHIIQNVLGCGLFHVFFTFVIYGPTQLTLVSTMIMMSFGNYNPGWRCLDANDTATDNSSSSYGHSGQVYIKDNCSLFESCNNVQFSPDTSTVVSEWGLLCGKAWIPSIIISIQMAGLVLGASVAGHLADAYGRKTVTYVAQLGMAIFNVISIFSTSWQMFAVLRFFLGVGAGSSITIHYVYLAEMVTMKWRGILSITPHWPTNSSIFVVACMLLKDWRHIQIFAAVVSNVGLIPGLWMPESLRWLEVKKKAPQFKNAVIKIAKMNRRLDFVTNENTVLDPMNDEAIKVKSSYSLFDIFKAKHLKVTLLITVPWLSLGLIYYALTFGVKALSGNFYINLLLFNVIEIPFSIAMMYVPNILGRKKACITFGGVCGLSLLGAAFFREYLVGKTGEIGVLVLAILGRLTIDSVFGTMFLYTVELYPLVMRGLGSSWGNILARIGSVLAPFLIPNNDEAFFTCYILMGVLACVVCGLLWLLPETKGRALLNTEEQEGELERAITQEM